MEIKPKTFLIETHIDHGNLYIKQIVKAEQDDITGIVKAFFHKIEDDRKSNAAYSQIFDGEPISLIAKPIINAEKIQSSTAAYLMKFPNDQEITTQYPHGCCPKMHIHPKGERNVLFFVGKDTRLLAQSLSPIIVENNPDIFLQKDNFPQTRKQRYHAFLNSGIYLIRLSKNTSHNFVALGENVAAISIHPNEYEEIKKINIKHTDLNNTCSNMQKQTIFLHENKLNMQECYPQEN